MQRLVEHAEHPALRVVDPKNASNHQRQDCARNQAFKEIHRCDLSVPKVWLAPFLHSRKQADNRLSRSRFTRLPIARDTDRFHPRTAQHIGSEFGKA